MTIPVGLVGLGNMGSALAERMLESQPVVGFDPSPERQDVARSLGVMILDSAAAVADTCDVVVLSLPRPAISTAAITDILANGADAPTVIIETSTVLPDDVRASASQCEAAGIHLVGAAILSGIKSVTEGTTTLLVGGTDDAVAAASAVLASITTNHRAFRDAGAAMAAKVINNAVAHDVYVVLSEAVAMGQANGIEIDDLVDMFGGPEAGLMRPLTHRIGERLKDRNFEGGMSTTAARKDSQLALALAQSSGIPLFATQAAHSVYEMAASRGLGDQDYAVIASLWDDWAETD